MEENEKRRNVELAYLSLMLSGKKVSECELASEVLKISRAKGEKSLAMLVQSSIKITVKVLLLYVYLHLDTAYLVVCRLPVRDVEYPLCMARGR